MQLEIPKIIPDKYPALEIENFLDDNCCDIISQRIAPLCEDSGIVKHAGPFLMAHTSKMPEYFELAKQFNASLEQIFYNIANPVQMIHDFVSAKTEENVQTCREGDSSYSSCIFRHFSKGQGSPIHKDNASNDAIECQVSKLKQQISAVLYLSTPQSGGELVIYDKKWSISDEYHRKIDFGYENAVIENSNSHKIKPQKGTLVFFNPQQFHAILPVCGNIPRMTLSMFLGYDTNGFHCWA